MLGGAGFFPSAVGRCSEAIGIFQVPREELSYQLDRSPKRRGRASINLQWNFKQTMCLFLHIRKTKYILTGCVCRELNFMFVDSWKSHIVMYLVKMLQRNVVHQEIHISCTVYIYISYPCWWIYWCSKRCQCLTPISDNQSIGHGSDPSARQTVTILLRSFKT